MVTKYLPVCNKPASIILILKANAGHLKHLNAWQVKHMTKLFIYGTLRRGGSNHFRMDGAEFVGGGGIAGKIFRIDWYPGLVCGGESAVKGELYRVSEEHLRALDVFEGIVPGEGESREYRRVKVEVTLDSGEKESAWVWEWIGDLSSAVALDTGDWLGYEPNPS
jgi:gamma-glutamylcyclotransferase (GGCT)/AIG2-like uncharacterized protein YtfP